MNIDELLDVLVSANLCRREEIRGCSVQEVADLEASVGLVLPARYREFLLLAGKGAGEFYVGTDFFVPQILGLNDDAAELLAENNESFALPDDAFVFLMHQGYQFNYFRAGEGDDPPVYYYHEARGAPVQTMPSFSAFLLDAIEWHQRRAARRLGGQS